MERYHGPIGTLYLMKISYNIKKQNKDILRSTKTEFATRLSLKEIWRIIFIFNFLKIIYWFESENKGEREKERRTETLVCSFTYLCINWFSYVSWMGIEPTTLALTSWAIWPGPEG